MSVFDEFLLLGNVWDVQSALTHQKLGFAAIGTSSAAVAASLGFDDGEDMPFDDLLGVVKAIRARVDLPLTVDIEAGYSRDVTEVICNIHALAELGVVGVNIEDSVVEGSLRRILSIDEFSRIIGNIKLGIPNGVFLNARTDGYIMELDDALGQTLTRAKRYENAGADGIFVPCIIDLSEIKQVVKTINAPLNVMCMPELPSFESLRQVGVKRVSMGPFGYNMMNEFVQNKLESVLNDQSFKAIFTA